jgi:hypothetical protein
MTCEGFDLPPSVMSAVERIIAIGDVHGDLLFLIELLKIARVLEKKILDGAEDDINNYRWIGGKTYVVQLGDQIDSCRPTNFICSEPGRVVNDKAEDTKIINFMDKLDVQAQKDNGRAISLLGNHEILNILGEMSYVSNKNIEEFGSIGDRAAAFAPNGEYGRKLICTRPTAIIIGSNLFVHAGILPEIINMIPKLKKILKESGSHDISREYTYDKSKNQEAILKEFITKCVHGQISRHDLYSIISSNDEYKRFWDTIFQGRARQYSEDHIEKIMKFLNKIPKLKTILLQNTEKMSNILSGLTGGKSSDNDIEILNAVIRNWLLGNVDKKYASDMQLLNSMFWTRILGSLQKNENISTNQTCQTMVSPVLRAFNVRNMIVAHTPQFDMNQTGINATCVNNVAREVSQYSLWRVDIGGSKSFDKFDPEYLKTSHNGIPRKPQVLEILNDTQFNILK